MCAERTLLTRLSEPDEAIESRMIAALDEQLGYPARLAFPAGTPLFSQDDEMEHIYILLNGTVKLFQVIEGREVIFHSQTVGKILGLLALTRQSRAFFTCRAVTSVELLKIRFTDLDRALQKNESLLVGFITVLLRSMARRSTRLVELQTEVLALNKRLAAERDTLARTLRELEQAQALLVESEKMATLGQLAAGVAHELNNPVAAINRAADFVRQDLEHLAAELPDGQVFSEMLTRMFERKPCSTSEQRAHRRHLTEALGEETLADRLVGMGIHTAEEYTRMAALLPGTTEEKLTRMERYHQLGGAVRNITNCADRISVLVKSLRAYSRTDQMDDLPTDLHEGLEDTLRLFSNRTREVTIDRQYAELPLIQANAGELNQVWTNLIANALDAMKDKGTLTVTTTLEDGGYAAVRIMDNGPGIPPENKEKIFGMRYTTRQGRIEFGLGLGLSISRNIVNRHEGVIHVDSRPGRTEFCVRLPISRVDLTASPHEEQTP